MSQLSNNEDDDVPQLSLSQAVESGAPLELTLTNVQRLQQQFDGAGPLYSSSYTVEVYVEDSQQCSQMDWEAGRVGEICEQNNNDELDLQDPMRTPSQDMCSRASSPVEIHAFDGRVISTMSTRTQTDWEWVDQRGHEPSSEVGIQSEKVISKPAEKSGTSQQGLDTALDSENVPKNEDLEMDKSLDNEVLDILSKDPYPQTAPAFQLETKQSPSNFDMITGASSSESSGELLESQLDSITCEYCQQPRKSPVTRDQLVNNTDPEELFCCEMAWKMAEFLLEEDEAAFAAIQESIKIDVGPHPPFQKTAKERAEQRLNEWEFQRVQSAGLFPNRQRPRGNLRNTICYRLSNEVWTAEEETPPQEIEIMDSPDTLALYGEEHGHKKKHTLIKPYESGQTFITMLPDGTGQVFYASGRLAILISAVSAADFTYVILEDKDLLPSIQAIFSSRGQATCYHPNGLIWLNLTQVGGTYCSDTGALKRRWSWLDHEPHVHAPPFQPVCLALSPKIYIRIETQSSIYLTFTSRKNSVRFNVGAKLKLEHTTGLMLPGPDMVQRHLQLKSAQIYSLLQRMQSFLTYQQALSPGKVKPQYSLISQMERLKTPLDKHRSAKKTKKRVHMAPGDI